MGYIPNLVVNYQAFLPDKTALRWSPAFYITLLQSWKSNGSERSFATLMLLQALFSVIQYSFAGFVEKTSSDIGGKNTIDYQFIESCLEDWGETIFFLLLIWCTRVKVTLVKIHYVAGGRSIWDLPLRTLKTMWLPVEVWSKCLCSLVFRYNSCF